MVTDFLFNHETLTRWVDVHNLIFGQILVVILRLEGVDIPCTREWWLSLETFTVQQQIMLWLKNMK